MIETSTSTNSQPEMMVPAGTKRSVTLKELAWPFLRLGTTAFGGPAAHIAMMEDEFVRRRGWLTQEKFLDLLGAASLIPGPSSTEVALYIGYTRRGWQGIVVAGSCFILPATGITLAIAWAYVRFGRLPQAGGILYGIKPVVIGVVVQALWVLGRAAVKTRSLAWVGVLATIAAALTGRPLTILLSAGLLMIAVRFPSYFRNKTTTSGRVALLPGLTAGSVAAGIPLAVSTLPLFLFFLKVGATVFGSGYVLLAYLRADLVNHWHWLTDAQLLDAIAVGQFTPGPVFSTATFIGYVVAGLRGAGVATLGIFLPGLLLVAASGPLVPRLRRSVVAGAFLDGVNVAALALMAVVTCQLGRTAIRDVPTAALATVSAVLLVRFRLNSFWLVVGGAATGLFLKS